jgi:hypothetical protein
VNILSDQRGWDYESLQPSNLQDVVDSEQISRRMFEDEEQRMLTLNACWEQAYDLLTSHWSAVKTLAGELLVLKWITGAEVHTLIRGAIGEEKIDWRLNFLQDDPINQRRAEFGAERKRLVTDFIKGVITEQELDNQMTKIQEERLKILQNSPMWHFYGSLV